MGSIKLWLQGTCFSFWTPSSLVLQISSPFWLIIPVPNIPHENCTRSPASHKSWALWMEPKWIFASPLRIPTCSSTGITPTPWTWWWLAAPSWRSPAWYPNFLGPLKLLPWCLNPSSSGIPNLADFWTRCSLSWTSAMASGAPYPCPVGYWMACSKNCAGWEPTGQTGLQSYGYLFFVSVQFTATTFPRSSPS